MGFKMELKDFNYILDKISENYKIYAPKLLKGKGTFSDTDMVRYGEVKTIDEIEFNKKSLFSPKETILPITQTLFYFTEDEVLEPKIDKKNILIFLRSCDIHAVKRLDEIYLKNGYEDIYYKRLREKVKFVLIECEKSFENCFCTSMGTNKTEDYSLFVKRQQDKVLVKCKDEDFLNMFKDFKDEKVEPKFIEENQLEVKIPKILDNSIFQSDFWKEYSSRCIACGRCNTVCGTCACFTMQDIFYKDNKNVGERRRVWSSCQIDGFTTMAGGHEFRKNKGDRMRFKVMHKIHDFNKRFGYHMCVGCGRCDDACPEYISFSNCVNKLNAEIGEEN
ncbi:anaerobic sulfite reductase subunit AsrA [Clostridium cochlearium]|uniref:Anaerobic sulfite reductase subunit A n=1 Tax=Clostridium cochlearium TaxID=1494 RepID=A0A240AY69_CLOCO|nr:anaerobic sulfite reductase subunit AsrA [Clostridium cochlearium]MBE6065155.1 anaerobic sulfite reductase subunit A [Clostridium cochlearium]NMA57887.1 anaerobic sulfite reductase subunit A [Clostridium cochlearium]NME96337.1 anaerobic sulfite reductase subunit A [Clostridium cochlearium]SDK88998.1 anaerobic sulfite reductase subunit A [Clostridium cochlearium]SNV88351.1 anaerobic sulfite reductase subunit A [Clostridium cochlearium]